MGKKLDKSFDKDLQNKKDKILKNIESDMHYISNNVGDSLKFDWIDVIENACPFVDNVIRVPKLTLVQDEVLVSTERAKRIMSDSIKDLAKHSNYIEQEPDENGDVTPAKILDIRSEETYNIYENRFLYTLVNDLDRFIYQKELLLKKFNLVDEKSLEYTASTTNGIEKIDIELKVSTQSIPKDKDDDKLKKFVEEQQKRIKLIREYITSWLRSEMITSLEKAHVQCVKPPLKPSNILLKNPNFQTASKLWEYIRNYDLQSNEMSKVDLESKGNATLLSFLDNSFLKDYFVLDSISKTKRDEREKICKYSIILLAEEVYRTYNLLIDNGYKISEEELLSTIAKEFKFEKNNRLVGIDDVRKKFKNEIDEYLERTNDL